MFKFFKRVASTRSKNDEYSILDDINTEYVHDLYKIEKCMAYLSYLEEPKVILESRRAHSAIEYLVNVITTEAIKEELRLIFEYKRLFDIFTMIFKYDYEMRLTEKNYIFLQNLLKFCCAMSNSINEFCVQMHLAKGTQALLCYLKDDEIRSQLIEKDNEFMGLVIGNLLNLSTIADYYRHDFDETKNVVLNVLESFKNNPTLSVISYLLLTNIVTDDEIEQLPHVKTAIANIAKQVECCVDDLLQSGEDLNRGIIEIENERVSVWTSYGFGFHLYELLSGILRLAVNDSIKIEIYEKNNFKSYLEVIIMRGNEFEKSCAVKLLWQLCFSKEIAKSVYDNKTLFDHISNLSEARVEFENLKKYCKGILWLLLEQMETETESNQSPTTKRKSYAAEKSEKGRASLKNHIMISYNSESRALCLQIKKELESHNHTVWIDVENIHGSSLSAMANAVEESKCVLICATEKYKQSPNCRAEAEYAFKLNKPFVPLIMQENYSPDGWLGILFGSKIYINFAKYMFKEASERLLKEISANCANIEETVETPKSTVNTNRPTVTSCEFWSKEDVRKWLLKETKIDSRMAKLLKDFNGNDLKKLMSIRRESPDYFYQSISQHGKIGLFSVVAFLNEFDKLN